MVNIVVAIAIIAVAILGTFIADRILFHPGRLRVWRSWFKHYYIALSDIRHLMLGCKEPPPFVLLISPCVSTHFDVFKEHIKMGTLPHAEVVDIPENSKYIGSTILAELRDLLSA